MRREKVACLCGDAHDGAVMSYDAFIYVLLRTAADCDGSFRTAFLANPGGTLAAVNHGFRSENLGNEEITLPERGEAQDLLANFLPDYDGTKMARMKVRFNWTMPFTAP
jgi:hypothetical protein